MSTTILSDGSGGQIHSFCAMNSFSMSFWMVPPSCVQGTPCSSATARYMASSALAEQLTVIEVVTRSRRTSLKSARMSTRLETATPSRPTAPSARRLRPAPPLDHLLGGRQPVLGHEHVDARAKRGRRVDARPLGTQQARDPAPLEEALHHVRLGRRRGRVAGEPVHQCPSLTLMRPAPPG